MASSPSRTRETTRKAPTIFALLLIASTNMVSCDSSTQQTDNGSDSNPEPDNESKVCSPLDRFTADMCEDSTANTSCIVHVDGSATPGGDGSSWDRAFSDIQRGIDAARCQVLRGKSCTTWQVWIAAGTYNIYEDCPYDTIRLRPKVAVYGGFSGSEQSFSARDFNQNRTIISGRHRSDSTLAVYHVVTGADEGTIDGISITGGWANALDDDDRNGAGIKSDRASPLIENCQISGNKAEGWGGGIAAFNGSPTVRNCVIEDNSAYLGGGMAFYKSSAIVLDTQISSNLAEVAGGGITIHNSAAHFESLTITHNTAGGNGGGIYAETGQSRFEQLEVEGNSTTLPLSSGGGMAVLSGAITLHDSTFLQNKTPHYGGGLHLLDTEADLTGSVFRENQAFAGGAILAAGDTTVTGERIVVAANSAESLGGGFGLHYGSTLSLENPIIHHNTAAGGAWIASIGSKASIVNGTVTDNQAEGGGGYWSTTSTTELINTIMWNNTPREIVTGETDDPPAIDHCWIEGWLPPEQSASDPMFIDPANGNYQLTSESPCIDAANGDLAPATDFEGNERVDVPSVENSGTGEIDYADIGAFEFVETN